MAKFILIDQSIIDVGGHHYEYARRVLQAARRAGYITVLATNRKCRDTKVAEADVYPVYRYGFWYRYVSPQWLAAGRRPLAGVRRWILDAQVRLLVSSCGMLWANRHNRTEYLRRSATAPIKERLLLLFAFVVLCAFRPAAAGARFALALVPFRGYLDRVQNSLRSCLASALHPAFSVVRRRRELASWWGISRKRRAFKSDTRRLFELVPLGRDDVVFIPTLEENEMLGLLGFLRSSPSAVMGTWHLLFRRNIYDGRAPDYRSQDERLRPLRNAFRHFQDESHGQHVFFYTDTEPLTEQYSRLGVVPFTTLPIPVGLEYHATPRRRDAAEAARVVYVGDARCEKGYHHLPRVVQDLWADVVETGRAVFVVQSNFNTATGEPPAVVARAQLEDFPPDKVRLLPDPLESRGYRELMLSADVVLVPYDHDNYYARSSGIFTEALVAGVPVIVPAGSWMAFQLAESVYDYHQRLCERQDLRLKRIQGAAMRWRIAGAPGARPMESGELRLSGTQPRFSRFQVPEGTTHLIVSFQDAADCSGHFVRLTVESRTDNSGEARCESGIVGGAPGCHASRMVALPHGTCEVRLGLRGAFSEAGTSLTDLRVDFLRSEADLPKSAAGVVYDDPREIAHAVREILHHLPHYAEEAVRLSVGAAAYHNADTLVAMLARRCGGCAPDRKLAAPTPYISATNRFPLEVAT